MEENKSNRIAMVIVIILVIFSFCCCCLIVNFYLESEAQLWSDILGSLPVSISIG